METIQKMPGVRKVTLYDPQNTISKIKHFGGTRMMGEELASICKTS